MLSIKLEPELKNEAQKIASQLGISITTVVKAKLKEFVRTKSLNICLDEKPSPKLIKTLKSIGTEAKSPAFLNAKDAINWLKEKDAS